MNEVEAMISVVVLMILFSQQSFLHYIKLIKKTGPDCPPKSKKKTLRKRIWFHRLSHFGINRKVTKCHSLDDQFGPHLRVILHEPGSSAGNNKQWADRLTDGKKDALVEISVNHCHLFIFKGSNGNGLGTQPQIQVSPQNIDAHEGDTLRLYCRASGSPMPKLTWLKNGGQIPSQVRWWCVPKMTLTWLCVCSQTLTCTGDSNTVTVSAFWPFASIFLFLPCVYVLPHSPPFLFLVPPPVLTFAQAVPSHGFQQFKSNSVDVLHRRNEELQVCPSVHCLSVPFCRSNPLSSTDTVFTLCSQSAWSNMSLIHAF